MRKIILLIFLILVSGLVLGITSCGGGGDVGGTGSLIADFDLEGEEYLADPDTPIERLADIFSPRVAHALPDLGFDSNSFPFNVFTGDKPVQQGLEVLVVGPDQTLIGQAVVGPTGRVTFSEVPTGFLHLNITGRDGHTYKVPVQVSENMQSRTRILVYRDIMDGVVKISAKTIHDDDDNGMNDDDFSYALFGRPRNSGQGGLVHLHFDGVTRVDTNGDGIFENDITEADDDGVASSAGDGDEDNDGIRDDADGNIDGDDKPNGEDDDIDGDGIPNAQDPFPDGTSPEDDYDPPEGPNELPYPGVEDVQQINNHDVSVWFKVGVDVNEVVSYNIYWSTTSPVDFETANMQRFAPLEKPSPDSLLSDNVIGLLLDQVYFFVVRAQDTAQPPNEDENVVEFEILMEDIE